MAYNSGSNAFGSPPRQSPEHVKNSVHITVSPRGSPVDMSEDVEEDEGAKRGKKRHKVNHACVYCRRSHMTCDQQRPCSRCVKRDIGHLCHDEPRENRRQSSKETPATQTAHADKAHQPNNTLPAADSSRVEDEPAVDNSVPDNAVLAEENNVEMVTNPQLVTMPNNFGGGYNGNDYMNSLQFQDIQGYHPNYMFNTTEVSNEFNFLNDFLNTSLLDDGALLSEDLQNLLPDAGMPSFLEEQPGLRTDIPAQSFQTGRAAEDRPATATLPKGQADKAREKYFMTAADPAGNDAPEERMNKLLKAKYDAGLLKPFNYVKGYARLNQYMERNLQASSRQRILRQLDRFRPKFRERMQRLTDVELVMIEMWFERKLLEYDRVFASMAIPACCWRRTGEIFRGNREMAELIHVPVENLRDGKLSVHEIFVEDSLVSYWEKFGAIAFDASQKAILTSCSLHSPRGEVEGRHSKYTDLEKDGMLKCAFSFTIIRDTHSIPSIIIGNFLPIQPSREA